MVILPKIGMGTFGSDKYDEKTVANSVYKAIVLGFRFFDCASVYGNEKQIGEVFKNAIINKIVERKDLIIASKVWNDMHSEGKVIESCKKTLVDLQLDYLDIYFLHWPFPNYHAKGCAVDSRNKDSKPFFLEDFMVAWSQMEQLKECGLVKEIAMSNMTIAKLKAALPHCKIKPNFHEMEIHPSFQQSELFDFCKCNDIMPIAYCPLGSPNRPERDRTPKDISDTDMKEIIEIANKRGWTPAKVCLVWAITRGQIPIPFASKESNLASNLDCINEILTEEEMESIKHGEKHNRLIKGQVFLWNGAEDWTDLWDENDVLVNWQKFESKWIKKGVVNMNGKMVGATLPGDSSVKFQEFDIPTPGYGQVLVKTMASTICGSDIRCIYREHTGKGAEGYIDNMIAGHEPCGIIVEEGGGLKRFKKGDRVIIYHISGCGVCYDCRKGYSISCTSEHRKAYGWQRHGGMAPYILAEEKDLIFLPNELSYCDGAQVACGFGTTYEALEKIEVSGNDAVLVVGLGPVGLAALMLAKAMGANKLIGVEYSDERIKIANDLGLCDFVFKSNEFALENILKVTNGKGVEKAVDCSANDNGRHLAIKATKSYGKIAYVGEGGTSTFNPSPDIIHGQKTIYGSWVTSLWKMEDLIDKLTRWGIHPDRLITHKFSLDKASEAYALMAEGKCGKVAVVFDNDEN